MNCGFVHSSHKILYPFQPILILKLGCFWKTQLSSHGQTFFSDMSHRRVRLSSIFHPIFANLLSSEFARNRVSTVSGIELNCCKNWYLETKNLAAIDRWSLFGVFDCLLAQGWLYTQISINSKSSHWKTYFYLGKVDPSSFDEAFHLVKSEIESNHLTQFFRSQYYKQLLVRSFVKLVCNTCCFDYVKIQNLNSIYKSRKQ